MDNPINLVAFLGIAIWAAFGVVLSLYLQFSELSGAPIWQLTSAVARSIRSTRGAFVSIVCTLIASWEVLFVGYVDFPHAAISACAYGLFFSFVATEFPVERQKVDEQQRVPAKFSQGGAVSTGGTLVLSGIWPVFGIGIFGALGAELYYLQKNARYLAQWKWHRWVLCAFRVVTGGGMVVLYGYSAVNAVATFQLGVVAHRVIRQWLK